jgi:predicted CopG family antitoxin
MSGQRADGVKLRNIGVHDDLWKPALAKAKAEGRSLADVIREALEAYLTTPPAQ